MAIPVNAYGERISAAGVVILGPNQFALLAALSRMPEYTARSTRDLCRAALHYSKTSRLGALEKSSKRMSRAWVTTEHVGRCRVWRLTPRGIGMMKGEVQIRILGGAPDTWIAAQRKRRRPNPNLPVRAGGKDDTTAGPVKLSPCEFALLAGLFDRPEYLAESTADLCQAAVPYIKLFSDTSLIGALPAASARLLPAWVKHARGTRRGTWRLTPKGIAMIEGTVPVHIVGVGRYTGIAALRERHVQKNRVDSVNYRWGLARADESRATLVREVDDTIERWCHLNARRVQKKARLRYAPRVLQYYARWYALAHGAVPRGRHILNPRTHGSDLEFSL